MRDYGIFEKVDFNGIVPGHFIKHTRDGSRIIKSHWHPELEINMVFEGTSRFFINGAVEDLSVDHMVLINSKDVHSSIPYYVQYDGFIVTGVTLLISYDFLKTVIPDYDSCYFVLNKAAEEKIRKSLTEMYTASEEKGTEYADILGLIHISEIVYVLATECCIKRQGDRALTLNSSYQQLEDILTYIHENYSIPLYTSEVAERFHFSKEYFCRFFKKYTGTTFKQYLMEYRIIRAEQLLANTDTRVSDIAQAVGLSDEGRFISQFRKYYGDTPGNYRKRVVQNPFYRKE